MIAKTLQKWKALAWLAPALTALGGLIYLAQAIAYVFIQTTFVDEGGYLYVGRLYADGLLKPFQFFGIAGWYPPLAYLIPGQIEKWFGPGLLTGRLFSAACGLAMLAAVWLLARRFGGQWWGAAAVWSFALTPIAIEIYSLALSQALAACLLAWALAGVLGGKRPFWQIVAGSILAGLVVMTRQNLFPLLPLLVLYVFWQHGKKAGWASLGASLLPILIIHAVYWPNILELWAVWLPARLTPFLDAYRFPAARLATTNTLDLGNSLLALLQGFRFHYFSLVGFFVCLFLWPKRGGWHDPAERRAGFFLGALFLSLALLHAWATVTASDQAATCTFCFTPYLSFFDLTAVLLAAVTFPSWRWRVSKIVQGLIALFVLLLSTGLGYAGFDRFGPWLMGIRFPAVTRGLDPRRWVPFITLWDILANKFHQDYWQSRVGVSLAAGLLLGILLVAGVAWVYRAQVRRRRLGGFTFGSLLLAVCLVLGLWLSPLMGGSYRQAGLCLANVPQANQRIGQRLGELIPAGSQVYWEAQTAVPLLYAPNLKIYPPQVYGLFSFRLDGDPQQLLKFGLWNDELARQWRADSEYLVTEVNWYQVYRPGGDLDTRPFQEYDTPPANPCDAYSYLIVYHRKP